MDRMYTDIQTSSYSYFFFLKFETNVSCKGKDSLIQEVKNENQNMDAAMLNRPDAKIRLENNFT